jgi:hypothetical protein
MAMGVENDRETERRGRRREAEERPFVSPQRNGDER